MEKEERRSPIFMIRIQYMSLNRPKRTKKIELESNALLLLVQGLVGLVFFSDLTADHGAGHGASLVHTTHHR